MHYLKVTLAALLFVAVTAHAQSTKDVFTSKKVTWYGLDFSQAKFIGEFAVTGSANLQDGKQIRDVYMESWNDLIINEPKKYRVGEFFRKEEVVNNLGPVKAVNEKINPDAMFAENAPEALTEDKIQAVLKNYKSITDGGLGLVFLVESFDKNRNLGTLHVTFFDTKTKQVLLTKRMQTKPAGFGLRNYWARTAYEAMDESGKNWKKWAADAGVKSK